MMSNKELEDFLEYEDKRKLLYKKIKGFEFWIYIRFGIMTDIDISNKKIKKGQNTSFIGENKIEIFLNILKLLINMLLFIFEYPRLKNRDIIIVNHPRRVKNEKGFYECKYTEALNKTLTSKIVAEFPYPLKHFTPIVKKNDVIYMDYIRVISAIEAKIAVKLKKNIFKESDISFMNELFDSIDKKFNVNLKRKYIEKIKYYYILHKIEKRKLYRFIKRINPKKIIEVVYYSFDNLIINEISAELNIETIELQHGIMGKNHIAYNFKKKHIIPQFPKKILTFSEYWNKTTRLPIEDDKVVAVGFPFFEDKVNKITSESKLNKNEKIKILFLSQASIGSKLTMLAYNLDKILDSNKYEIIYKLHPGEFSIWKQQYKYLMESDIKVISNEIDLYELFSICDIQIGVYSTAVYEGLGFELDTLIYKIYGSDIFEDLQKQGYVKYINNENEIKDYLNNGKRKIKIEQKQEFWKKDSLNNIIRIINLK